MKNILLAACGLSPQVITETLYALLHEGRQPHAVQVITTRPGKERLLAGLFDASRPRLATLLADFSIRREDLDFSQANIHTLKNSAGAEIDDIVTAEDDEVLLQACLDLAFRFSREPDTAVWFLVAGGRKTMTSCLTLAAQLYGRPQDRILHVLVSPEFESCRDFWYPPRQSVTVQLHDEHGQPIFKETRYAEIRLITIPFVSVRNLLDDTLLDRPRPPAELMQSLIRDTPRTLTVNLAEGKITYGQMEMDLHPSRLALYAYFAELKKNCTQRRLCAGCSDCFVDASAITNNSQVTVMYTRTLGARLLEEMSNSGIGNLNAENFHSYKSKIRHELLQTFGPAHIADLEIASIGTRPNTRYGIRLDRARIRMEW